jgi:hypothetical protein
MIGRPPTVRRRSTWVAATALTVLLAACGSSSARTTDAAAGAGAPVDTTAAPVDTTADPVDPVDTTAAPVDTTPTTPPGPPMTSCTQVVHIGDSTSVGLTSASYLPQPLNRIDVQYIAVGVEEFRPEISGARSIVEHLKGQLSAEAAAEQVKATGYDGCWVLALGTTDAANISKGSTYDEDRRIDKMMAVVGDDPVLWVNVKTLETSGYWRNENMQAFNKHLEAATSRYPNLQVYDWASVARDEWFSKDDVHYTSAGFARRAHLIAQALAAQIPA